MQFLWKISHRRIMIELKLKAVGNLTTYENVVSGIENSEMKIKLNGITKEVLKQLIGSEAVDIRSAFEAIKNTLGYRCSGLRWTGEGDRIYYFIEC